MVKLSWFDDFTMGDRLWKPHHDRMSHHNDRQLMIMYSVLISYCICRRPSWKPKIQSNGAVRRRLVEFLVSTRFTRKTLDYSIGFFLFNFFNFRNHDFIRMFEFFAKTICLQCYSQIFIFQKVFAWMVFAILKVKKLSPKF